MKKPNANRAAGTATACGNGGSAGNSAGNGGSEGERLPGREQLRQWLQGSDDVSLLDIEVEAERARPGAEAQASEAPDEVDEAEKPPRGLPEPGPPSGARPLKLTLVYCSAMADPMLLQKVVLPQARAGVPALAPEEAASARPGNMGAWQELKLPRISKEAPHTITWRDYICRMIFEANAILFCDEQQRAWSMSAGTVPGHSPSEAATEVSVRGPKDGFVEQLHTNTALIRYRLRTPGLRCEQLCVGTRSGTKAALLYEADIANPQLVDAIRDKLSGIDADDIVSTRHLQDLLVDRSWSLLPRTSYTGRPDFAVQCLAAGRAVILLDGNPTAIIAPANLFLLMKSAEDAQQNYFFVNFTRLLRYVCLLVTCFPAGPLHRPGGLPRRPDSVQPAGDDHELAPRLAAVVNRGDVPRAAADRDLPRGRRAAAGAIGQTLTVVGGLIIGDAAVRAGLISPVMIVMAAMTFVAGSTLVNQSLTGAVTLIRFYVYASSSALGFFGFMISTISVLVYLTRIQSFGVPYLTPISPIQLRDLLPGLFILPFRKRPRRAEALRVQKPLK